MFSSKDGTPIAWDGDVDIYLRRSRLDSENGNESIIIQAKQFSLAAHQTGL